MKWRRLAVWLVLLCAGALQAQPVTIGMTLPLTGPDAAYGQGLRQGAQLAAARANAAGGLPGRQFDVLVLDDGGDPRRAAANARQLLQAGAVALSSVHGARATAAVAEVLAPAGADSPVAALVAPATSADLLRTPPRPGVFHLRAGTAEQASAAMLHLDTLGLTQYALLTQTDALGESGLERMLFELARIAMRPAAVERLPVEAKPADVQRTVARLCAARPEAVILALDAGLASVALTAARRQPCASHYFVFAETGAALAARAPGVRGPHPFAGLLVTQVVPHPNQLQHPLVAEYQRTLAAHGGGQGSHPSLEGYLAVRVIQEALRPCGRDVGRACLLQSLATRSFELPGMKVQFGSAQRQARPFVDITMLDAEGRFRR